MRGLIAPPALAPCSKSDRLDWMYQGGVMARQEADQRIDAAAAAAAPAAAPEQPTSRVRRGRGRGCSEAWAGDGWMAGPRGHRAECSRGGAQGCRAPPLPCSLLAPTTRARSALFPRASGLSLAQLSTPNSACVHSCTQPDPHTPPSPSPSLAQVDAVVKLPSFYAEDTPVAANEVWQRLHSDPLFAIKQQEQAARKAIVANPVKMQAIKSQVGGRVCWWWWVGGWVCCRWDWSVGGWVGLGAWSRTFWLVCVSAGGPWVWWPWCWEGMGG